MKTRTHGGHLAQRFLDAILEGIHHGHIESVALPPRTVPAASDWPGWSWADKSGNGYEPEETGHGA